MSAASAKNQLTLAQAMSEAPTVMQQLLQMSMRAEKSPPLDPVYTLRVWDASAGTYTYHTHVRVPCQKREMLAWLADCFFHASVLPSQPWYAAFLGGRAETLLPQAGALRSSLNLPRFDFGLGREHGYRQCLTEFAPEPDTRVLVLRSVLANVDFPQGTVPAYTLSPTGDVLRLIDGCLHWHHICTVGGVGLLPPRIETALMNTLRFLRLDTQERRAYREEAESFIRWVSDADAVHRFWQVHCSAMPV